METKEQEPVTAAAARQFEQDLLVLCQRHALLPQLTLGIMLTVCARVACALGVGRPDYLKGAADVFDQVKGN